MQHPTTARRSAARTFASLGAAAAMLTIADTARAQSVSSGGSQGIGGFIAPGQAATKVIGGQQILAARMADGPKRAPGRLVTAPS